FRALRGFSCFRGCLSSGTRAAGDDVTRAKGLELCPRLALRCSAICNLNSAICNLVVLWLTDKILRLVDAAGPGVDRALRVRAERARPRHGGGRANARALLRDQAVRRLPLLHPLVDRRRPIHGVGAGAAGAM